MNLLFTAGSVFVNAIVVLLICCLRLQKKVKQLKQFRTYTERDVTFSDQIIISKRELETVFDAISELICIIDKNYRIIRVNKNYAVSVGMPIRNILNKHCYQVFRNRYRICDKCPARETFKTGNVAAQKTVSCRCNDEVRYYELQTFPVFDETGEILRIIERIRDVTEEKRFFEQLVRSEKLASIGIMTSGVAHEMNNPLSGISGIAVNLLQMPEKFGFNEKAVSRISMIADLASRATTIMDDLLHLSRKHDQANIKVNINTLLVKTVNAIHLEVIPETEYQYDLENSLQPIDCDPSKIQQVIVNLATNALQAIQEEKNRCKSIGKEYKGLLQISSFRQKGKAVVITVSDNGIGIPEKNSSRIFDPFFSTRPAGQGTGLGLSISHKIVEEHGGKIFFERINGLTRFSIILPIERKYNVL